MTDSTVVIACNVCVHKQIPTAEVRSPWMARGPAKLEKEKALKSVCITMAVWTIPHEDSRVVIYLQKIAATLLQTKFEYYIVFKAANKQ